MLVYQLAELHECMPVVRCNENETSGALKLRGKRAYMTPCELQASALKLSVLATVWRQAPAHYFSAQA